MAAVKDEDGARTPWVKPQLKSLGKIVDLVQGVGKIATADDQDPNNTAKSGTG